MRRYFSGSGDRSPLALRVMTPTGMARCAKPCSASRLRTRSRRPRSVSLSVGSGRFVGVKDVDISEVAVFSPTTKTCPEKTDAESAKHPARRTHLCVRVAMEAPQIQTSLRLLFVFD